MATADVTLQELLSASVVTRVISRIRTPMSKLQNFWGMNPGGPATNPVGGKIFSWDIFDQTRMIAQGRPPGTGPANQPPQKIGSVQANAYRSHESVHLLDENLHRTRQLGSFWDRIDSRGQNYVARQEAYVGQKFKNAREFLVSRMMRGSFEVKVEGDNWIPVDSGGHMTVDFQIPDGNKGQLDMTGAGAIIDASWATNTTDILGHILAINAAFEELHGWPLKHMWVSSTVYNHMLNNTSLQTIAGTSNTVFDVFQPTMDGEDGYAADTGFIVRFKAIPWLDVHVYDGGLMVDGSYSKFIPDTHAFFTGEPMSEVAEWLEGSELIRETVVSEPTEAVGLAGWTTPSIDPAGFSLKAIDVGLPALYVPSTIASGTVVF